MEYPHAPIRVLLADNHPIVRAGLRALLEKMPEVEVAGEAGDGREALQLVESQHPHVVFMDISMPGLNGLEATARLTRDFPDVQVVMLSRHDNEDYFWQALRAGASGYLLKRSAITELEHALRRVVSGEIYLSGDIANCLLKRFSSRKIPQSNDPLERLSQRQREILQLIAEGQTTKSIALILKLSPKTVEYHRAKLMDRLNVHDIPGLVRFALRVGLLPPET